MTEPERRPAAELTPVVLGLVTILSGAATGLFSDLRLVGQIIGLAAVALWFVALGSLLWALGSKSKVVPPHIRVATFGAFVLTAGLVVIALQTGPRLSSRTLVLTERGQRVVHQLCGSATRDMEVGARVALSQLDQAFVHIELLERPCSRGNRDARIRSDDLLAVLPEP